MKFNIEVDVEDIINEAKSEYFDYDEFKESVIKSIKSSIIFEVRNDIYSKIKGEIIKSISEDILSNLANISESIKTDITNEILDNKDIEPYPYSSKKVKAKDYVYEKITSDTSRCVEKIVKETAEKICQGLRDRYDLAFATAIVNNLKKQNMLDEKVASLLINNEK